MAFRYVVQCDICLKFEDTQRINSMSRYGVLPPKWLKLHNGITELHYCSKECAKSSINAMIQGDQTNE